jgi:hypothetical protein
MIGLITVAGFTMRVIITSIAGGVAAFDALALIRSIISGGKRVVWEILRIAAGLVCMLLAGLSRHGNIGPWGTWIGFGGLFVLLLTALVVGRSVANKGPQRCRGPCLAQQELRPTWRWTALVLGIYCLPCS